MSTQKEMKVVDTNAANQRIVGRGTDAVAPGQTSVAVAAKATFESTQQPSNPLAPKPPKKHFRKKFEKKMFSETFPKNEVPKRRISLRGCGAVAPYTKGKFPPAAVAATPSADLGVAPAGPDSKAAHKDNDIPQEHILEKFDKPNLNVDKKEFQNDMKKYGFKGLATSRWA